jgi:hypothetical protein
MSRLSTPRMIAHLNLLLQGSGFTAYHSPSDDPFLYDDMIHARSTDGKNSDTAMQINPRRRYYSVHTYFYENGELEGCYHDYDGNDFFAAADVFAAKVRG